MSLINQMLQDLEQRQGASGKTQPISGEVRAVPATTSAFPLKWSVLAALGVIVGLMAWAYLGMEKPEPAAMPESAVAIVAPAPAGETMTDPLAGAPRSLPAPVPVMPAPVRIEDPTPSPASPAQLPSVPVPAPVAEPTPMPSPVVNAGAALPVDEPPPKAKPASKTVPGNASAPIKTVSSGQQSDNLYRQSLAQLQQGRVSEAQNALNKALDLNPGNLKARQTLLGLLIEGGRADEASQLLRDGLALSPEQSGFSMALARLQVEAGDGTTALDTLREGLPHAGEDAEYHAFYAALLQRDEQHADAVQHYLAALRSNPAMPAWLVGVGISLQAQGNANDAAAAFRRAQETGQLTPQLAQFVEQRLKLLK